MEREDQNYLDELIFELEKHNSTEHLIEMVKGGIPRQFELLPKDQVNNWLQEQTNYLKLASLSKKKQ